MTDTSTRPAPADAVPTPLVQTWSVLAGFCERDWSLHLRSPMVIAGTLAGPLLLMVAIGFGIGANVGTEERAGLLGLVVPGLCAMGTLLVASQRSVTIYHDLDIGLIDEILAGPVPRSSVVLAQCVSSTTLGTAHGLLLWLIALVTGLGRMPEHPWVSVLGLALFALLGSSLCTAMAYAARRPGTIQALLNLVVNPLFFLSGALYDIHAGIGPVLVLGRIDPLHYGIALIQTAYGDPNPDWPPAVTGAVLVTAVVTSLAVAAALSPMRR